MRKLKLLIDRNIEHLSVLAESAVQEQTLQWGEITVCNDVHGYRAKELPRGDWKRHQLKMLPTIARLVHEEKLIFCTSAELGFESWHASVGLRGRHGDIFRGIEYEEVPAAIERSYFRQTVDFRNHISGNEQAKWCKEFLLRLDERTFPEELMERMKLPEFMRRNIANLGRFKKICSYLDTDDHIRDAFHLWTAETNGLDYFLTADKKFINKILNSTPLDFPTPPISPASLLERLEITEFDPLPLTDRTFRSIFEGGY